MENLPVEVVGNILSCLGDAKEVLLASVTCRKWRDAFRYHLRSLTFDLNSSPIYCDLLITQIEMLITTTIFQTNGLQGLSIVMNDIYDVDELCGSTVTAWLIHTRECLKSLYYDVGDCPSINILQIFARRKLEKLFIARNKIMGVEPNYQRFPCLKFISLNSVSISPLDLSLLLTACPKIESLSLINLEITVADTQVTLELSSQTLKTIIVEAISLEPLDKFILEADALESLLLKDCAMEQFDIVGKGSLNLRHLKLDNVTVMMNFSLCEPVETLEEVDVSNFTFSWATIYQMISRSSNLRVLRLWDVEFEDFDEVVYLEVIAKSFPCLRSLSFVCDLKDHFIHFIEEGSYMMDSLTVLEVGWTTIHEYFYPFLESFLKKCPNLKKLIIHGTISDAKTNEEYRTLAKFTSSMVRLMREYMHLDIHFEYE